MGNAINYKCLEMLSSTIKIHYLTIIFIAHTLLRVSETIISKLLQQ